MINRNSISILLIALWCSSLGHGQSYFTREFTSNDGLGNQKIADIVQDWRGYLWLANYGGGVSCYDGREFITFDENDGLSHDRVKCLALDQYQRLWIGTQGGGISILQGKRFVNFADSISGISDYVNCIFRDKAGVMWIGTDQGLFCYHNGEVKGLSETTELPYTQVQDIFEDDYGSLWVSFWEQGLYRLVSEVNGNLRIDRYDKLDGLIHNTVTKIQKGPKNKLVLGTMEGAQYMEIKGEEVALGPRIIELPAAQVFDVSFDSTRGTLISFGRDGVFRILDVHRFEPLDIEKEGWVYTSFVDRENIVWLSLWDESLCQVRDAHIRCFGETSGLAFRQASTISNGNRGILLGTTNGIFQWSGDQFKRLDSINTSENRYSVIHQDVRGRMWAVQDDELKLYDGSEWSVFRNYQDLVQGRIMDIASDSDGNVWIANWDSPLVKFNGRSFSIIRNPGLSSNPRYLRVFAASDNTIWLGSKNEGLFQLDGNKVVHYGDDVLPSARVIDIAESSDRSIWVACQGGGVVGIRNGEVVASLGPDQGISPEVVSLEVDELGMLWIGSKDGLYTVQISELLAGRVEYAIKISENDGLISEECLPNQLTVDEEGTIWLGTKRGVAQVHRDVLKGTKEPVFPFITIRDIRVNYREVTWDKESYDLDPITLLPKNVIFDHDQGQITFDIETVSTRKKDNILYRYRLVGQDDEFSPVSSSPSITYHDIEPGDYELRVIACDSQGRCSDDPVTFSFKILKPFWKTWWFYLIAILLANLLLYLLVKLREKNLVEGRKLLEYKVSERTWEIEQQKKIIEENNRNITDSIRYAKRIQSAILVSENELKGIFAESFLIHLPKDIVSGDFYFSATEGDYDIFAVADCTGHGVPGAVMGMLGFTLFNEAIRKKELTSTASTFNFIAQSVVKTLRQQSRGGESKDAMDASIIIYNRKTHELEFSGANNNAIIAGHIEHIEGIEPRRRLVDGKELNELIADRQPLGINKLDKTPTFTSTKVKLHGATTIYLMSDGYVDQFGGLSIEDQAKGGKKFKISRLRTMIAEVFNEPLTDQKNTFHKALSNWKGPLEQVDDITLAAIRIHAPE